MLIVYAPSRFLPPMKANGPDVSDVGGHSGRMARRRLGAAFEVTVFDGWSLRSPVKMALETWQGERGKSPMIGRNAVYVFQALDAATASKPREAATFRSGKAAHESKRRFRSGNAACVLSGAAGIAA